uniref:Ring finger protein 130 n=1 Tax=Cyprinus carpio carpio TaxID=630221 RepID=A0A9J8C513_CYPCA
MLKRLAAPASCSSCLLAFLLAFFSPRCTLSIGADKTMVNKEDYYSATVNATVLDHKGNPQQMVTKNDGRYGQNSPKTEAKGIVIAPAAVNGAVDMQGCCPTRFIVPPKTTHWVAIMQRGKCTFKEKILKAAAFNASAVIIYNNSTKEDTVTMAHEGTGDIVAVMITESFGKEILGFLEKNQTVLVSVMVGSRGLPKNINRGSLVFVSISFIVLMIISSAWLIFYFIQKIRDTSARDRSQRRLGDAAKKAISKLTTRTVKRGDKETEPDFNHCAVCIEGYQLNDVVRILPCNPTCPAWTTWLLTWIGCPAVRLPARGQRWWTCPLRPASVWSLYATPVPPSFPLTKNSFLAPERSTLLSLQGVSFPYFSALTASLHLLFRDICVLLRLSSVMSAGVCAPQQCVLPFTAINILY